MANAPERATVLLARLDSGLCALPLESVVECFRPLPAQVVPGAPPFLLGVSIIRGAPVPVVDLSALVGQGGTRPGRFVLVRLGARRVALAVAGVVGTRSLDGNVLREAPPLLQGAEGVSAVGVHDEQLLLLLRPARIVPDEVWRALESGEGRA